MPEKNLFEYAVVRVMPRVEREEFMNVGVIVYCPKQKFLQARILLDEKRFCAFSGLTDCAEIKEHLYSFEQISLGSNVGGPIAQLDMPSRFRWLTATRSTIVQASKVHPGLCTDALQTLDKLYRQLVL
jgi:hypothetical protein